MGTKEAKKTWKVRKKLGLSAQDDITIQAIMDDFLEKREASNSKQQRKRRSKKNSKNKNPGELNLSP